MGIVNSKQVAGNNNKSSKKEYEYDDNLPVMGDGYCPIYDAALIGDWERLVHLCEEAKAESESAAFSDDNGMNERLLADSIMSMDIFKGGNDYDIGYGVNPLFDDDDNKNEEGESSSTVDESQSKEDEEASSNSQQCQQQQEQQSATPKEPYTLFIDAKGNTPLHVACRRDPPLTAINALLSLHDPTIVWMKTADEWIPLHLACHCGCSVAVANELLNTMESSLNIRQRVNDVESSTCNNEEDDGDVDRDTEEVDPLLPRDRKGRTPLHLACASSRDPQRRPALVQLLLLRSQDPRRAALARDWIDFDQRMGVDLALGELKVLLGKMSVGLDIDGDFISKKGDDDDNGDGSTAKDNSKETHEGMENGTAGTVEISDSADYSTPNKEQEPPSAIHRRVGRSPLNLIEDDYREELQEALLPGFSITHAIALCRGEDIAVEKENEDTADDDDNKSSIPAPDNLDAMYECWAMLSVLLLSAGTPGSVDRVKEALGDVPATGSTKPCHDVVQDFQAIHQACQALDATCPSQFKQLAKKFLQGQVDKRSIASVSALKSQWESRSQNASPTSFASVLSSGNKPVSTGLKATVKGEKKKKKKKLRPKLTVKPDDVQDNEGGDDEGDLGFGDIAGVRASSSKKSTR